MAEPLAKSMFFVLVCYVELCCVSLQAEGSLMGACESLSHCRSIGAPVTVGMLDGQMKGTRATLRDTERQRDADDLRVQEAKVAFAAERVQPSVTRQSAADGDQFGCRR